MGISADEYRRAEAQERGLRHHLNCLCRNPPGLSPRELEVLTLLAEGNTKTEIAETLYIEANTVKTHLQHIREKLGARNTLHAITIAMRQRLLA